METNKTLLIGVLFGLVLASAATSAFDCGTAFQETVDSLYTDDETCMEALRALVLNPSEFACSDADKATIGTCLEKMAAEWLAFEQDCPEIEFPAVGPTEEPPAAEGAPMSEEAMSSTGLLENIDMDLEDAFTVQNGDTFFVTRRFLKTSPSESKLYDIFFQQDPPDEAETVQTNASDDLSCSELLVFEGLNAFIELQELATGGTNAQHVSLLALIGTILLGMMLV